MLHAKHENSGPFSFSQAFWNCISKPIVWHRDVLMQPIRTIWIILVEDHTGTIPFEFGQIPVSGSREEVVWKLQFENLFLTLWPTYATNQNHLNNFDREPFRDHSCWVWSNSHKRFKRRSRLNLSLYNSM